MNYVKNARIAFFLSSINLADKLELANSLRKSLTVLDGDPLIVPIPDSAPADIPRIILKSKNEKYALNVAIQRIDIFYNFKENDMALYTEFSKEILQHVNAIDKIIRGSFSANINRLGLIVDFNIQKEDAIKSLQNYLNKELKTNKEILEGQIHLFNKVHIDGFNINNWIRIFAQIHDNTKPKFLLSNDINTEIENKKSYSNEETYKFFTSMLKLITENIKEYA